MADQNPDKHQSSRYQDYVICDGRYIGRFDDMYRNALEVPWHQDKTVHAIFSDITVAIIRKCQPESLLDVGCGLGFMTERLRAEIPSLARVVGLDVSETAIIKAATMFPKIEFRAGTIGADLGGERFDVVASKDVLWYVLEDLPGYLSALASKSKCWVYIGQSFPERRPFLGEEILPNAAGLLSFIEEQGYLVSYFLVERDAEFHNREYAHLLIAIEK